MQGQVVITYLLYFDGMTGDYLIWSIVTLVSAIFSFIIGWKKQKREDQKESIKGQQQFNEDNTKFRQEVLSLLELARQRIGQLETQIDELKSANHQQALRSIQDAGRISKLLLLIERYKQDIGELQSQVSNSPKLLEDSSS